MANDTEVTTRSAARSHSQLSTYLECPRRWDLEKARRLPRRPGPWLAGGTAVHKVIEMYLRSSLEQNADGGE